MVGDSKMMERCCEEDMAEIGKVVVVVVVVGDYGEMQM